EVVSVGNGLHCISGKKGDPKRIVSRISNFVRETLGSTYKNTKLLYPIPAITPDGRIIDTILTIQTETNSKAKKQLQILFPEIVLFYYFVAKVHIAEVEMEKLQQALPTLESLLENRGDAIFQIDFTQDFFGCTRPKSAYFAFQDFGFPEARGTILDNTASVGEQVCTWIQTTDSGYTTRTKLYNKIVSQFEAGEVQTHFEAILRTTSVVRRNTFAHLKAQKRLYSNRGGGFPKKQRKSWYKTPWRRFLKREKICLWHSRRKGNGRTLDRCLLLADRPQGEIHMTWGFHNTTGTGDRRHTNKR
ncbi:unnamed protein product, partial [Porites lobata]